MRPFVHRVSLLVFVAAAALSAYVFCVVQVLQSYPFPRLGAYGTQPFLFLTYTEVIEVSLPVSFGAFVVWEYGRLSPRPRVGGSVRAIGRSLIFFGAGVAAIVYTEIHLVWGELWYGVHAWPSFPGGGGYPWGGEQVAYNLCFVRDPSYTQSTPNCSFLNYDWLLGLAVTAVIVGVAAEFYFRSRSTGEREEGSPARLAGEA